MTVHLLKLHSGYRCRHAGVCCTEPWPIPVEVPLHRRLEDAMADGRLHVAAPREVPRFVREAAGERQAIVAGRAAAGCVFFEPGNGRRCAIHGQLGHDHLPSACQHFPRVVTMDPRGVHISLSHLCPTAGSLLASDIERPFELVRDGAMVTPGMRWEGLDARDVLPPRVAPGVLWDWDALTVWERGLLDLLDRLPVGAALASAMEAARRVEHWRPGRGPALDAAVAEALSDVSAGTGDVGYPVHLDRLARQSAPGAPEAPAVSTAVMRDLVEPAWPAMDRAVARYLAARVVANWTGYHTSSARAWAASVVAACAVLRTEAGRQCEARQAALDFDLLRAAAAEADRLLVHRLDAAAFARALDAQLPLPSPHGTRPGP